MKVSTVGKTHEEFHGDHRDVPLRSPTAGRVIDQDWL